MRVPAPGKNHRLAVCGAFNPVTGQTLSRVARKITGREVAGVIAKLASRARRTGRLVIVVLDNAQVHKGRHAQRAWARHARWVRPFWLPAYCPDLNDIERIWKREKENYFANTLPPSVEAFERRVRRRFRALAHIQCRVRCARSGRTVGVSRMIKNILTAA